MTQYGSKYKTIWFSGVCLKGLVLQMFSKQTACECWSYGDRIQVFHHMTFTSGKGTHLRLCVNLLRFGICSLGNSLDFKDLVASRNSFVNNDMQFKIYWQKSFNVLFASVYWIDYNIVLILCFVRLFAILPKGKDTKFLILWKDLSCNFLSVLWEGVNAKLFISLVCAVRKVIRKFLFNSHVCANESVCAVTKVRQNNALSISCLCCGKVLILKLFNSLVCAMGRLDKKRSFNSLVCAMMKVRQKTLFQFSCVCYEEG